jgi:UDP-3-O-[3-hydroxymyristoyl] glucosamine N-acyltransferase
MEFSIAQIATMLGGEVKGDASGKISMLAKIQDAKKGQVAFLSNPKYEQFIYTTQASAVIVKKISNQKKNLKLRSSWWMIHTLVSPYYWKNIISSFHFKRMALSNLPIKAIRQQPEKIFTVGLSPTSAAM